MSFQKFTWKGNEQLPEWAKLGSMIPANTQVTDGTTTAVFANPAFVDAVEEVWRGKRGTDREVTVTVSTSE